MAASSANAAAAGVAFSPMRMRASVSPLYQFFHFSTRGGEYAALVSRQLEHATAAPAVEAPRK